MFNGDMGELMKQAKQMQEKLQQAQEEVTRIEVAGQSGAGLVSVSLNGKYDAKSVSINADLLKEDKAVLEDLIAAAFNDAVRKLEKEKADKMGELTGGLGMPGGMKMPF